VAVDPKPPANGIEICGDAVAIHCQDDSHQPATQKGSFL
jgi:hypothetical protein